MCLRMVCLTIYTWHKSVMLALQIYPLHFHFSHLPFPLSVKPKTVPKSLNLFWIPPFTIVCSRPNNYRVTPYLRKLVVSVQKLRQTHWQLKAITSLLRRVNHLNWKLIFKWVLRYSDFAKYAKLGTSVHMFAWQYLSPFEPIKRI
jgi:hypothetical protein